MERHKWKSEGNKGARLNEEPWGEQVEFYGQAVSRIVFSSRQRFYPARKEISDVSRYVWYLVAFVNWKLMWILALKCSNNKYNYSSTTFNYGTKQQTVTSNYGNKIIMSMAVENIIIAIL